MKKLIISLLLTSLSTVSFAYELESETAECKTQSYLAGQTDASLLGSSIDQIVKAKYLVSGAGGCTLYVKFNKDHKFLHVITSSNGLPLFEERVFENAYEVSETDENYKKIILKGLATFRSSLENCGCTKL